MNNFQLICAINGAGTPYPYGVLEFVHFPVWFLLHNISLFVFVNLKKSKKMWYDCQRDNSPSETK